MTQGQTSYGNDPAAAVPGMIADLTNADVVTGIAGEDIPFGRFVTIDPATGLSWLPKADADVLFGVAAFVPTLMGSYPQGDAAIRAGEAFAVLRRGRVWADYDTGTQVTVSNVKVCNDVTAGAQAAKQGKATMDATSTDVVRPPVQGAIFFGPALTGSLAQLEVNFFGGSLPATLAVTTAMLAAKSVTTAKIADSAVETLQLGAKQVTAAKIADVTITNAQIAAAAAIAKSKLALTATAITGSLSTVAAADVKAVLISIIAALVALDCVDSTT